MRRDGVRKLKNGFRRSGWDVDFLTSSSGTNLREWICQAPSEETSGTVY